jgi:hypothetical protein
LRFGAEQGSAASILVIVAAMTMSLLAGPAQGAELLSYYSDYFSFIGEDAQGKVAFALDNNRGQDGERFQAEHFAVLHDERMGWIALHGTGAYPNPAGALRNIPDSADFAFSGKPENGIRIHSSSNSLTLDIQALKPVVERAQGEARYWLGSAAATLAWRDRTLRGRVIYEYLYRPGWNRLTRKYFGQWHDFHALYLRVDGGDLYFHHEEPVGEEPLHGREVAFIVLDNRPADLRDLSVEVTRRTQALGLYRWPQAWRVAFVADGVAYRLDLALVERKAVSNWILGGFSMGIANGELTGNGNSLPVYGLAEIIP